MYELLKKDKGADTQFEETETGVSKVLKDLRVKVENKKGKLEKMIDEIEKDFSEFDSLEFEPDEEISEIEEEIEKLEETLDIFRDDDKRAMVQKEIDDLKSKIEKIGRDEETRDSIKDLFDDIGDVSERLQDY